GPCRRPPCPRGRGGPPPHSPVSGAAHRPNVADRRDQRSYRGRTPASETAHEGPPRRRTSAASAGGPPAAAQGKRRRPPPEYTRSRRARRAVVAPAIRQPW